MTKRSHHYKLVVGSALGICALAGAITFFATRNGSYETLTVQQGVLTRTITVTGSVVPVDEVTLAFVTGGRVASVAVSDGSRVTRGQTIATLDGGEVLANVRQAQADRAVAQAELAALVGTEDAAGKLASTQAEAFTTAKKALSVADTQVKTNVDTLFDRPKSGRPEITPSIKDYFARQSLGQERVVIGTLLDTWAASLADTTPSMVTATTLATSYTNLERVRIFFGNISDALSDAETTSQITDARISEFRTIVAGARAAIDTVMGEVIASSDALRDVSAQQPVQQAQLESATASIDRYNALLKNYTITAPFDGVATEVFVTAGEVVAANQQVASLVSDGTVELEVYVPEVQIAYLDVGDAAKVTLDAYGTDLVLGATVTFVDTQSTERNGIVTYRTKLSFNDAPAALRAGMTATIAIDTVVQPDVLVIPQAVVETDAAGATYVQVLTDGEPVRRDIILGMTDTRGGVLVESGLSVGEEVVRTP
ncbi:MAG: hypothetical protein RL150_554 [Candidatus Parcubacteria bacterium]|jgi:RND family efflux transporter MFP subunit